NSSSTLRLHRDSPCDGDSQASKRQRTSDLTTQTAAEDDLTTQTAAENGSTMTAVENGDDMEASSPMNEAAARTESAEENPTDEISANQTQQTLAQVLNGGGASTNTIGGIEVVHELYRLWKDGTLAVKAGTLDDGSVLPKSVLFDSNHDLFVDYHPAFKDNEQAKYKRAMTLVAMGISKDQWRQLIAGDLEDEPLRKLFAEISNATMEKAFKLEIESGIKPANAKPSSRLQTTLSSLSARLVNIRKSYKTHGKSDLEVDNIFARESGSVSSSRQSTLSFGTARR
ncbi:hypothetical protein THAOC_15507, partial [Thalassiosira oceanica]